MCPGVGGIFCCFNEVVPKLLPGYEVFYDEHREDNEEEDKYVHSISEYMCNVLFDLFKASSSGNILS